MGAGAAGWEARPTLAVRAGRGVSMCAHVRELGAGEQIHGSIT